MKKQNSLVFSNAQKLIDGSIDVITKSKVIKIPVANFMHRNKSNGRAILVVEFVETLSESSINNYDLSKAKFEKYKLNSEEGHIEFNYMSNNTEIAKIIENYAEVNVISVVEIPLIGRDPGLSEEKKKIIEFSELIIVYLILVKKSETKIGIYLNKYIYESYSKYGFFIVNEVLFNKYITKRLGSGVHNLIEAFTTTEIATELFNDGLMVLCWGLRPWVYMINSCSKDDEILFFPSNRKPDCCGKYLFSTETDCVSVIPGNELFTWSTTSKINWPKLKIKGNGNIVQLDLYVMKGYSNNINEYTPIPYFNLYRKEENISESEPILEFDILNYK